MEEIQMTLNAEPLTVRIIRKNNKNIYFRFDEKDHLIITVHPRISTKKIIKLVEENEKSLVKLRTRMKRKQDEEGEIRILGLKYDLKIDPTIKKIQFDNGTIYSNNDAELKKYITNLTKKVFNEEIEKILQIMPNIPKFTLKIRKMKTRWGVCNYIKNTVTLNSELIKYERNIIDYVIIHEFSHFTHHDHSAAFWSLVAKYYPNYKLARKELREE